MILRRWRALAQDVARTIAEAIAEFRAPPERTADDVIPANAGIQKSERPPFDEIAAMRRRKVRIR